MGTSVARRDLRAKLTGAAYVHDMELPGMVYGRVCRPPSYTAKLKRFDAAAVRALPGVVSVTVSGNFIGVCAEREEQALQALEAARGAAAWEERADLPASNEVRQFLPQLPSTRKVVHKKEGAEGQVAQRLEATYSKPYIAHASIGPSCALARFADGRLTVWSHTQGSYRLRGQIAKAMGMPDTSVDVIHADGAGCYGHNGADDAALDAALLARACGRPVLLQWTRADELAWSPFGSAMVVRMAAALDKDGRIVDWQHEMWSHTHIKRPGWGEGINLLAAWHADPPHPVPPPRDNPLPVGGGDRNAVPLYDFARQEVAYNFIADMPLRASGAALARRLRQRVRDRIVHGRTGRGRRRRSGGIPPAPHEGRARARGHRGGGETGRMEGRRGGRRDPRPRHRLCALQEPQRVLRGGCRHRSGRENPCPQNCSRQSIAGWWSIPTASGIRSRAA